MPSFDAAPLYQDLVAAITTLFTVYTGVQIKFTFFNKNENALGPGLPWLVNQRICSVGLMFCSDAGIGGDILKIT